MSTRLDLLVACSAPCLYVLMGNGSQSRTGPTTRTLRPSRAASLTPSSGPASSGASDATYTTSKELGCAAKREARPLFWLRIPYYRHGRSLAVLVFLPKRPHPSQSL